MRSTWPIRNPCGPQQLCTRRLFGGSHFPYQDFCLQDEQIRILGTASSSVSEVQRSL